MLKVRHEKTEVKMLKMALMKLQLMVNLWPREALCLTEEIQGPALRVGLGGEAGDDGARLLRHKDERLAQDPAAAVVPDLAAVLAGAVGGEVGEVEQLAGPVLVHDHRLLVEGLVLPHYCGLWGARR